jgi:hypothetical protein
VPHIDLPEDVPGIRSAMMFRPETAEPLLHLAEAPPRAQPRRARTDRRRSGLRRCPNRRQMRESTGGSAFRLLGESDLVNGGTRSAQATPRIGSQAIGQDRRMKVHRRAACRRAAPDDSEAPHLPLPGRPQQQAPPHHSWGGAFSCGSGRAISQASPPTQATRAPSTSAPSGGRPLHTHRAADRSLHVLQCAAVRFPRPQERAYPWHARAQAARSQRRGSTHQKGDPVEAQGVAAHRGPRYAEDAL